MAKVHPLDDPARLARHDPSGMRALVAGLPEQAARAWAEGSNWPLPGGLRRPRRVVIAGMGGSAIGADMVTMLATRTGPVPVQLVRGYELPSLDAETLFIACSYSGNTEETLACWAAALAGPATALAITTGGQLAESARANGRSCFIYQFDGPPRSAFGYGFFPLLAILQRLGVVRIETAEVEAAIEELRGAAPEWSDETPASANAAKQIAERLHGRIPVVIGPDVLAVSARRWAGEISECSKQFAVFAELPEMHHNMIVGFEHPRTLGEQARVVLLDGDAVFARNRLRVRLTAEALAKNAIPHEVVDAGGRSAIAAALRAAYLGDWVSIYLAALNEVDPTPTPILDGVKAALAGE